MKKIISLLLAGMMLATLLTGCGSDQSGDNAGSGQAGSGAAGTSTSTPSTDGNKGDYTYQTSSSNPVVTIGDIDKSLFSGSILLTSIGQSADISMLDAMFKKIGADYDFDSLIAAEDVAAYDVVILSSGMSSKGLGAAGISMEDEMARAEAIKKTCEENGITVILAHMGGSARRGANSDEFNQLGLDIASYVMVVEEGNTDNLFTDAATEKGIPITLLNSISNAMTPLTDLFG